MKKKNPPPTSAGFGKGVFIYKHFRIFKPILVLKPASSRNCTFFCANYQPCKPCKFSLLLMTNYFLCFYIQKTSCSFSLLIRGQTKIYYSDTGAVNNAVFSLFPICFSLFDFILFSKLFFVRINKTLINVGDKFKSENNCKKILLISQKYDFGCGRIVE